MDFPNTYPRETPTRTLRDLGGLWKVAFDFDDRGEVVYGHRRDIPANVMFVGVPGSFNDQFVTKPIRDFVGVAWYYRHVMMPSHKDRCLFLRFGSVNYHGQVYLDGEKIGSHSGGHLPFTLRVPEKFHGREVLLTVAVDNRLTWDTVPPGFRRDYTKACEGIDQKRLDYHFDFFHYCGLNRTVHLIDTGPTFTADATITTESASRSKAVVAYSLVVRGQPDRIRVRLQRDGQVAAEYDNTPLTGKLTVANPCLWTVGKGGLYDFVVECYHNGALMDVMIERIGLRTVRVQGEQFLVNDQPVYFKGFGRHEDFAVMGRHLPMPVLVRDYELMKWIGANSFRTTHYPYAEESMMLADEMGFMVIDETPGVGFFDFGIKGRGNVFDQGLVTEHTWQEHARLLMEMIQRDKNRACVVMWSVANEPASNDLKSRSYLERLVNLTRELDPTRPVTCVLATTTDEEATMDLYDVICLNRYYGWYDHFGHPETVDGLMETQGLAAYRRLARGKPVMITEFGADTIAGMHSLPDRQFTEEFQVAYLEAYFRFFDKHSFIIGEHIWNFADFNTKQGITRVYGNRKGIFTRDRQPKAAAFTVRARWLNK